MVRKVRIIRKFRRIMRRSSATKPRGNKFTGPYARKISIIRPGGGVPQKRVEKRSPEEFPLSELDHPTNFHPAEDPYRDQGNRHT